MSTIDQLCINTIRTLSMDAVQKANSGHPGMPMGAAPMAYVLWTKYLRHNPDNPKWFNRDRFILSAGHGSMLLYSLFHLSGYELSIEDIKNFRQWGSRTAGHPETHLFEAIETTTGPLGQGFANGVGMAIAQKYLGAKYNKPDSDIIDYRIFAIVSDGDLMEGVSSEAASLAGHLKLGNIIYLYDDNNISIDGSTDLAFTEDVGKRFEAYNWYVQEVKDGNDIDAIETAISNAVETKDKPSLIKVKTRIAFGSPNKEGTSESHGSPLGAEEIKLTKKNLGWEYEEDFHVPAEVSIHMQKSAEKGKNLEEEWNKKFNEYREKHPEDSNELDLIIKNKLPENWDRDIPVFPPDEKGMATRSASGKVLNSIAKYLPSLIGGSADLTPSNNTYLDGLGEFQAGNYSGRYLRFGVREHAMGSILNGIALTNGMIPYGGTFLIFSEYMRPPIRLAALMEIRPIFVYTHDSIGLGEDGPTHQPVEQLISLRSIPNLTVIRPADANETAEAWRYAVEHKTGPVALALTRQNIPVFDRTKYSPASGLFKGAYILSDCEGKPDVLLIATGSEVQLAVKAQIELSKENISSRIISFPSWEIFEKQDENYKQSVFPKAVKKRVVIEAGSPLGWERYAGDEGVIIGIDKFGSSAPGNVVMGKYGFTVENVVGKARWIV
jgi:transketolase